MRPLFPPKFPKEAEELCASLLIGPRRSRLVALRQMGLPLICRCLGCGRGLQAIYKQLIDVTT